MKLKPSMPGESARYVSRYLSQSVFMATVAEIIGPTNPNLPSVAIELLESVKPNSDLTVSYRCTIIPSRTIIIAVHCCCKIVPERYTGTEGETHSKTVSA